MRNKIFYISLLLLAGLNLSAQLGLELVPNGGFEEIREDKKNVKKWGDGSGLPFNVLRAWKNPSHLSYPVKDKQRATPDYYLLNEKESNWMSVITSKYGNLQPHENGMVGILVYSGQSITSANYREYLSVCLRETLIPGEKYTLRFDISNGYPLEGNTNTYGRFGISNLGILFSKGEPSQEGSKRIKAAPQLLVKDTIYTEVWKTITFTFEATTNHSFLTIGNFNDDYDIYLDRETGGYGLKENNLDYTFGNHCYYFIDNVSLQKEVNQSVTSSKPRPIKSKIKNKEVVVTRSAGQPKLVRCGEKIKLNKLLFDKDQFVFQPSEIRAAHKQLTMVTDYMKMNPELYAEISGHTNYITNPVSRDTMLTLSQQRAETARDFLVVRGIAPERIHAIGFGPDRPRSKKDNSLNRRVEVEFLCADEFGAREMTIEEEESEEEEYIEFEPEVPAEAEAVKSTIQGITPLNKNLIKIFDSKTTLKLDFGQKLAIYYMKELWKEPKLEEEIGIVPIGKELLIKKIKRNSQHYICDGQKLVENDWYKVTVISEGKKVTGWIFGMNYLNVSCY